MHQLLVSLDVDTATEARALADALRGVAGGFKIGKQLFTSYGPSIVEELSALAHGAGLDGVVASPREIRLVRATRGSSFVIVTPGIRGASDARGDQQRTATAAEALAAGASYLVVGRPITTAANPREAAERIAVECRGSHVA